MEMTNQKMTELLGQFPLFAPLAQEDVKWLARHTKMTTYKRHELVYDVGDTSDHLYFLFSGSIKIGTFSNDGREVIKHILHPMAIFGELSLVAETKRKDFAYCMKDVKIATLKLAYLKQVMRKDHSLSMRVLQFIGKRLHNAENRLESLIFKDARERIIEFLRDSALKRGKKIGFELLIKHTLTQQDIANITGTSRQTVTSVLNELKKANLIHFNRRSILIRDIAQLT